MRHRVIMVYPQLGLSGVFVFHAPIALLYASIGLVKDGVNVEVLDTRLYPNDWRLRLKDIIKGGDVLAVGISVMSGSPIRNAFEIGKLVKSVDPEIKIVWGGPHATFFPSSILEENWYCDYVVSGYAVDSFRRLVKRLMDNKEPDNIEGISYRRGNAIIKTAPDDRHFEFYDYKEIPYGLIKDYSPYGQLDQNKRIFSIYSAMGCPYKCSFCCAPAQYKNIEGKHWVPISASEVANHIEFLVSRYRANYIYFIDDDSFVDLAHVEQILDEIKLRRLPVNIGFRGARISEIKHMSAAFLDKLADSGTDILHIGAESGSDRILKLINKNCTVDDIIECNKKLSLHPKITAAYNFMTCLPTETMDDIKATRDLMLRLVKDNPRCIIFPPARYRPLPGTELFSFVQNRWGYKMPATIDEWIAIESEGKSPVPWCGRREKAFSNMLFITGYFIDNKIDKVTSGRGAFYGFLRAINRIYGPIAKFRLKNGIYGCLLEDYLYKVFSFILRETARRRPQKVC